MLKEIINFIFGFPNEKTETKAVHFTKKENAKSFLIFLIATIICYWFDAYYLLFFAIVGVLYFAYHWIMD